MDGHGGTLVPTMGALHEGHLALIRRAKRAGGPVVVSVFVNPTQFAAHEDLERYPRRLEADAEAAAAADADLVFAPALETVYPPDAPVPVPALPRVATEPGLEDAHRPEHFAGVCQVVARLFDLAKPRRAVFGEKDYQQLRVLQAMAHRESDRWPGLEVIGHETIRDGDGLALSSRNDYLSRLQRDRALGLIRALRAARAVDHPRRAEQTMLRLLAVHRLDTDYAVVRDAESLGAIEDGRRPGRALIAARLDGIRLIDNMAWGG